jgi:hypothetical protein
MNARVKWDRGGEASVERLEGDAIVLQSTIPAPPGSRLEGVIVGEPEERVRVKVHSSRKQGEGGYVVQGRLIDATRGVRERLKTT